MKKIIFLLLLFMGVLNSYAQRTGRHGNIKHINTPAQGDSGDDVIVWDSTDKFLKKVSQASLLVAPQTLSVSGSDLTISGGNTITLPSPNNQTVVGLTKVPDGATFSVNNNDQLHTFELTDISQNITIDLATVTFPADGETLIQYYKIQNSTARTYTFQGGIDAGLFQPRLRDPETGFPATNYVLTDAVGTFIVEVRYITTGTNTAINVSKYGQVINGGNGINVNGEQVSIGGSYDNVSLIGNTDQNVNISRTSGSGDVSNFDMIATGVQMQFNPSGGSNKVLRLGSGGFIFNDTANPPSIGYVWTATSVTGQGYWNALPTLVSGNGTTLLGSAIDLGGTLTKNINYNAGAFSISATATNGVNSDMTYGLGPDAFSINYSNTVDDLEPSINLNNFNVGLGVTSNGGDDDQSILFSENNVDIRSIGALTRQGIKMTEAEITFNSSQGAVSSDNLVIDIDGVLTMPSATNSEITAKGITAIPNISWVQNNTLRTTRVTFTNQTFAAAGFQTLLPAPGANSTYDIISVTYIHDLTTAYNTILNHDLELGGVVLRAGITMNTDSTRLEFKKISIGSDYEGDDLTPEIINLPFILRSINAPTGGVGDIKIDIVYRVVTL